MNSSSSRHHGILCITSQLIAYVVLRRKSLSPVGQEHIYIYIYIESSTRQNLTPKPETFSMHLYTRTPLYSSSYKICVLLFISIFKSLVLVEVWFWTLNMDDNILHVALGQNVKEYKSILLWALQNSGGKTICVIHVHQPANLIPISKLPTF